MLAQAEGIPLTTMDGYGGHTPWSTAGTLLLPLLDHRNVISAARCREMLPRLHELSQEWTRRSHAEPSAPQMVHD